MNTSSDRITEKPRLFRGFSPRRGFRFFVVLTALLVFAGLAQAATDGGLELRPAGGGEWQSAATLDSSVHFQINGLLAEVEIRQQFRNDSDQWLEGRYLLPMPEDSAVHDLRIETGGRIIVGEIQEKQQARETYRAAAESGQRAALVEQNRPNLFRTQVANVGPGDTVDVVVSYWQPVRYADGKFSLVLPLTFTPKYADGGCGASSGVCDEAAQSLPASTMREVATGLQPTVTINIDLDPGLPIASLDSPSHALSVNRQGQHYQAHLTDLVVDSDRDFVLEWTPAAKAEAQAAVFSETVDGEHYALLMLMPPTQAVEALPRELIILIDTSGSMTGTSIEQARDAVQQALDHLRPGDYFNLIRFESRTEALFGNSQPADADHIDVARQWVDGLEADGGTELAPALSRAFQQQPVSGLLRQVVLVTDAGIGNERQLLEQIDSERGDARLFPVGIGSAPNGYFLREAARIGRGSEVVIRAIEDVNKGMGTLFNKLDRPSLRDLDVNWPAGAEAYPERLPDLYAGEPLMAVARLPQLDGEVKASGLGKSLNWSDSLSLSPAINGGGNDAGVGRLWARSRIASLEDSLRQGADESKVREQVIDVALRHHLVSSYTSLVAVDRTPVRPESEDMASVRFQNATPDGQLAFAHGGTGARSRLSLAICLLLLGLAVAKARRLPGLA